MFYGPMGICQRVDAFYYEGYIFQQLGGYEQATPVGFNKGWRIRFTPIQTGSWSFKIIAQDHSGSISQMPSDGLSYYTFSCCALDNADGFVSKANSRFLKRDVVNGGVRQYDSFFPIGPNLAWYNFNDYGIFAEPYGIYEYEKYIDSLANKANYMRIWLNRFQGISLYGPEFTQTGINGNHIVYFDNTINQKDCAELDYIVSYAKQHGIAIMPCLFNAGCFRYSNPQDSNDPSKWAQNPFHTILGLESPCEFFTDDEAKAITKNLLRYIVSRWGYATNVISWELWNEVDKIVRICDGNKHFEQDVLEWHEEMQDYIYSIDSYKHMITTSLAGWSSYPYLSSNLFEHFDFVQNHTYGDIQEAELNFQVPILLYKYANDNFTQYSTKLQFIGEFGFSQGNSTHISKDPFGVNLHNSLWSSLFLNTMGSASFWWWPYVDSCSLFRHFSPVYRFCDNLPIPSNSFTPHHTGMKVGNQLVFSNGLQTFYMINTSQDTIYGWSQDTAFAYPSLRRLTDSIVTVTTEWGPRMQFKDNAVFDSLGYIYTLNPTKRPHPSSNSNTIILPISNQPIGTNYMVKWYDAETGNLLNTGMVSYAVVCQDFSGNKYLSFQFPSVVRNLQQNTIYNKFGDAVFTLTLHNPLE